jgi:sigma-E factor negative regulatory protein RseC
MIEENAIILTLEKESDNESIATLEVVRKTACGLCGQTRGCGNAVWGKLFAHRQASFKAKNSIDAKVGDSVIVGIDESAVMKSALYLYIVPLVTMLMGAILVAQLTRSDLMAIVGAILGLIGGFVWVKGHASGQAYYQINQPRILRLDHTQSDQAFIEI